MPSLGGLSPPSSPSPAPATSVGFVSRPPSFFSRWFCLVGGLDHFEMANARLHDLSIIVGTCLEGFVAEMRTLRVRWLLPLWSLDALRWWCLFLFATPVVCISEIIMTHRGCGIRRRPPRCSCAWRGMLCLGYASSGEEGIVSEDISRSRMRLVQTRRRASCLGLQCGRFSCPCVGVMLPRGCGLCVEGQAVEVAQRSVRTNLRGMCA